MRLALFAATGLIAASIWTPADAQIRVVIDGVMLGTFGAASCGNGLVYSGPGDVTAFSHWAGFRAYNATIMSAATCTQALARFRRSSDNHECDIIVGSNAGLGNTSNCSTGGDAGQSASSFCNATTCFVRTLYDQVGAADLIQTTTGNQPTVVFSCIGALPCFQETSNSIQLASSSNITPATGNGSLTTVASQASGTGASVFVEYGNSSRIAHANAAANKWLLGGSTSLLTTATVNEGVWHAGNGVINGAFSAINIDGVVFSGSVTGSGSAGKFQIGGGASSTVNESELGFADNVTWASGTSTALCQNEQAYYGSGNFGAAC